MSPSSLYLAPFWPAVDIAVLEGGTGTRVSHQGYVIVAQFRCDHDTARGQIDSPHHKASKYRHSEKRCHNAAAPQRNLWIAFGCRDLMLERGWTPDSRSHRVLWPGGGGRRAVLGHMSVLIKPGPSLSVDHRMSCSCTTDD